MPTSSSLADQLAILGVDLATWPEEPEDGGATGNWIQRGLAYAEGVRTWRAHLRNSPKSTKGVIDLLLQHQSNNKQLTDWDRWLSAAIQQEVKKVVTLDRWKQCIALIRDAPMTKAELLGAMLFLAGEQQLAGAAIGALRLMKNEQMTTEEAIEVCALLSSQSNISWRMAEAQSCPKASQDLVDQSLELIQLLIAALSQKSDDTTIAETNAHESITNSLERLLIILGEDDKWSGIPKSKFLQVFNKSGIELALTFLEDKISWPLPIIARAGHARMIAAKILIENGKWKDIAAINSKAYAQLNEYYQNENMRTSQLEIIRTETDLLSQELSIALSNGSLEPSGLSQSQGKQEWKRASRSQLGQDLWVLEKLGWKQGGFFVEFGATDGVLLSNSWLLEKHFGWKGICAEPNPEFFERLQRNRSCTLSSACVYRTSGERMSFILADAFGGLEDLGRDDLHVGTREAYAAAGNMIQVTTTSLYDLLQQNEAPAIIDYLSIDTEGSELAILEGFDWSSYQIRCITVEHNFTPQREPIYRLLESKGYERREAQWDDWYFK